MNEVSTQVEPLDKALVNLNSQLEKRTGELQKVLPSHISPERFQRTLLTVATVNPDLLRADRRSLITACMKAAQDGLLPDGREAAIVVFENSYNRGGEWVKIKEAQYMPMVYGLRKKILQSGEISSFTTQVVYRCEEESGRFLYEEGTEAMLRHKPMLDMTDEQALDENIIATYSMVTFKDGAKSYEVLPRRELNKIQRASKTGSPVDRNGKPRVVKGPWKDWYSEMCRKSAARRHSKTLPMSGDLLDTLNAGFDDAGAGESVGRTFASAEPDAPVRLPPAEEMGGNDEGEAHDEQTGEIISEDDEREAALAADREAEKLTGTGADEPEDEINDVREALEEADEPKDWSETEGMIVAALKERVTVPDVNSYMVSNGLKIVLEDAPKDVIDRIEAAKLARIAEIQNGAK
jgi:recombination protein RecT